jgi:replicative DNA helicase
MNCTSNLPPPQVIECEESVLAGCLCMPASVEDIIEQLTPDFFYKTAHQKIFQGIIDLQKSGSPVDLVSLTTKLRESGDLESVGGASYLARIQDFPIPPSVSHYCRKIKDAYLLRCTIETANKISNSCFESSDAAETIDEAQKQIMAIHVDGELNASSFRELSGGAVDRYENLYKNRGRISGITTGFSGLDKYTCGFQKSELIILAARPSMGKSSLVGDMVKAAAKSGEPVGGFSLEMSKSQWIDRCVASEAMINSIKFRSGYFSDGDWDRINHAMSVTEKLPIYIDDTGGLHYREIRSRARKMVKKYGCKMFFIDHLQLCHGDSGGNRDREIGSITAAMKEMAKEFDVPVILLSQLNRKLEDRPDKKPMISDLRDSGNIEQDADMVLLLYRRAAYNYWRGFEYMGVFHQKEPHVIDDEGLKAAFEGDTELIIAKQRNGPTGATKLFWQGKFTTFHDLERNIQTENKSGVYNHRRK